MTTTKKGFTNYVVILSFVIAKKSFSFSCLVLTELQSKHVTLTMQFERHRSLNFCLGNLLFIDNQPIQVGLSKTNLDLLINMTSQNIKDLHFKTYDRQNYLKISVKGMETMIADGNQKFYWEWRFWKPSDTKAYVHITYVYHHFTHISSIACDKCLYSLIVL